MRLIAKKPCSFGGQSFFIGEQVPVNLVVNPESQEKLGVLAIAKDESEEVPATTAGTFSQKQVDEMVAAAVAAVKDVDQKTFSETFPVTIIGAGEEDMAILVTPEDVQTAFLILQKNAEEGIKEIETIKSENALIIVHAIDNRKTVKEAAKKQAENLFSTNGDLNESSEGNETTDTNTEGADT